MSDEEEFFDDDFLFWDEGITDGVAAFADDLAEHAVHSPVWLDNDPTLDFVDYWSDWDYYSDEYYDGEVPLKGSKKLDAQHSEKRSGAEPHLKKRRREAGSGQTQKVASSSSSGSNQVGSVVRWRPRTTPKSPSPVPAGQEGTTVALLKDWRTRCGPISAGADARAHTSVKSRSIKAASETHGQLNAKTTHARSSGEAKTLELPVGRSPVNMVPPQGASERSHDEADEGSKKILLSPAAPSRKRKQRESTPSQIPTAIASETKSPSKRPKKPPPEREPLLVLGRNTRQG